MRRSIVLACIIAVIAIFYSCSKNNAEESTPRPAHRGNNRLYPRLRHNGVGQRLNLWAQEINNVVAFLQTLSGTSVYTDQKWSNPFK